MKSMQYIFPLLFIPPPPTPPTPAEGPLPAPTPSAAQPPNSLLLLGFRDGIPLSNVLGKVHMVVDPLDTLELVKLSSNDEAIGGVH